MEEPRRIALIDILHMNDFADHGKVLLALMN